MRISCEDCNNHYNIEGTWICDTCMDGYVGEDVEEEEEDGGMESSKEQTKPTVATKRR